MDFIRSTVVVIVASLTSVSLSAQTTPTRPDRAYRGLFGGNGADPASAQHLDLNLSLYGAYDDNVLADRGQQGTTLDPRFQQGARYGGGDLSIAYGRRGQRASFDLGAGSNYRYYPSVENLTGFQHWASAGFSAKLGGRSTLRASQSASYSPYYQFASFPGLVPQAPGQAGVANPDFALVERPAITYVTSAGIDHQLTRRASVSADYHLRYTDFRREDQPLRDWRAGGSFGYRLTRHATARLGYHYRKGSYGLYRAARPIEGHDIDAGVDYNRALSVSRRTTVGFSTGSGIYRMFDPRATVTGDAQAARDYRLRTRWRMTGKAYLNREVGRSWHARLDYERGLQFVEGFPDPFFSDSVAAEAAGFAGARTRITFNAAYTNGQLGLAQIAGHDYDMYTASAGVQFGLTRWAALSASYFYYHYLFGPAMPLPPGVGRGLDRSSVRIGVNLWAPLLR